MYFNSSYRSAKIIFCKEDYLLLPCQTSDTALHYLSDQKQQLFFECSIFSKTVADEGVPILIEKSFYSGTFLTKKKFWIRIFLKICGQSSNNRNKKFKMFLSSNNTVIVLQLLCFLEKNRVLYTSN